MKKGFRCMACLALLLLLPLQSFAIDNVTVVVPKPTVSAQPTVSPQYGQTNAPQTDVPQTPAETPAPVRAAVLPKVKAGKIYATVAVEETNVYAAQDLAQEAMLSVNQNAEIEVTQLGLAWCAVKVDGKKGFVCTADLTFSAAEKQLAIVHLKNTTQLPLHKDPATKSKTLKKIPNGTYVVVLEQGETFSRVLVSGKEGYLQNSYLSFRDAWTEETKQAVLKDPEKPNRKTTVNLRSVNKSNGKKIKALKTGTKVTVLNESGDWAEIELNGIHGYIMAKFIHAVE